MVVYHETNLRGYFQIFTPRRLKGKGEVGDEILFSTVSGTEFDVLTSDAV